jgi:hypothetical protein
MQRAEGKDYCVARKLLDDTGASPDEQALPTLTIEAHGLLRKRERY